MKDERHIVSIFGGEPSMTSGHLGRLLGRRFWKIGQQVVTPPWQAAAAFVGMKAICRSLNLNFRIETSRPCTKA
jgi:hypothetical protein